MILKNFATKNSTQKYSDKYKNLQYSQLGNTGLLIANVGFGTYRIDIRSQVNRDSLKNALISGINLIDTSSTYTNGNSELLVGDVLKELVSSGELSREAIVIVTKGGYLQGHNYEISQSRKKEGNPFPDLVEYQDGLEHCIHPDFLEDQITRSLDRLGIATIDVYLLHNPEYYLKWSKNNGLDLSVARKEYYSRIKKAFEYLETEVQKGRINYYGISSNTFPSESYEFDFTSLETIVQIAEDISENNHFSVIEFPMNIAETNAYKKINQSDNTSLLEFAEKKNLGVLINRPLNAVYDNQLVTLAEPSIDVYFNISQINKELHKIIELKESLLIDLEYQADEDFLEDIEDSLFAFQELQNSWLEIKSVSKWQAALNQYFFPRLYYARNSVKNSSLNKKIKAEILELSEKIMVIFNMITAYYNSEHSKLIFKIKENLNLVAPELSSAKNISAMAIRALRSTKGITAVLVGMVQPNYVVDVIDELQLPVDKNFNWDKIDPKMFKIFL